LKFKADFHSEMSVYRHELGGGQPPTPFQQFQPCDRLGTSRFLGLRPLRTRQYAEMRRGCRQGDETRPAQLLVQQLYDLHLCLRVCIRRQEFPCRRGRLKLIKTRTCASLSKSQTAAPHHDCRGSHGEEMLIGRLVDAKIR